MRRKGHPAIGVDDRLEGSENELGRQRCAEIGKLCHVGVELRQLGEETPKVMATVPNRGRRPADRGRSPGRRGLERLEGLEVQ